MATDHSVTGEISENLLTIINPGISVNEGLNSGGWDTRGEALEEMLLRELPFPVTLSSPCRFASSYFKSSKQRPKVYNDLEIGFCSLFCADKTSIMLLSVSCHCPDSFH